MFIFFGIVQWCTFLAPWRTFLAPWCTFWHHDTHFWHHGAHFLHYGAHFQHHDAHFWHFGHFLTVFFNVDPIDHFWLYIIHLQKGRLLDVCGLFSLVLGHYNSQGNCFQISKSITNKILFLVQKGQGHTIVSFVEKFVEKFWQ